MVLLSLDNRITLMKRAASLDTETMAAKKQRLKEKRRQDFVCKKCKKNYDELKQTVKGSPKLRHLNEHGRFDYCESCWKKVEYENYKAIDQVVLYFKENECTHQTPPLFTIEFS